MVWRVYYGHGEVIEGVPIEQVPPRDVQVIVQEDERVGWYTQTASDYYVWDGSRWRGVDIFGLYDYLLEPGWKRVLFGRTIDNEAYQAIWAQAQQDMGAAKSAYLPRERRP